MTQRVFNIPASAPFLPTLIEALHGGKLGFDFADDPLTLSSATLYLPTRRACRLLREAFLDRLRGDGAILPRIIAIGDIDEDEIAFAESAAGGIAADALALPPAMGSIERRLLLTRLVMTWSQSQQVRDEGGTPLVAQTPAAASALADDLARLMDDMTTRQVPWERLDELVPDEFDRFWQLTLRFLQIARKSWPEILREEGKIEAAARRDALIKAETARLARKPDRPVIVAGSTGSIPATADLIAAIARLPHGAVVLPGLDTDLDEDSWRLIAGDESKGVAPAPGHPQFAMQALLARMGIKRDAVVALAPARGRERQHRDGIRAGEPGGKHAKPGRTRKIGNAVGAHRAHDQRTLKPEVDASRSFGDAFAEAHEQERRGNPNGAAEHGERHRPEADRTGCHVRTSLSENRSVRKAHRSRARKRR